MSVDGIPISSLPQSPQRELTVGGGDTSANGKKSKSKSSKASKGIKSKPNLIKVLREAVGKDFSRITMPVYFNEPLSFAQRVCEDLEHWPLLDRAADPSLNGTATRLALVSAFVVSHYAATIERTGKPFNPLLGETFDYVCHNGEDDGHGVAILSEQVSHHPPITAVHAVGKGWSYYTAYRVKSKFHGNTFEAWPEGSVHITFDDGDDHYVYDQVHTFVNNIVVGSLWIDNIGEMSIRERNHGKFEASVTFKKYASSSSSSSSSYYSTAASMFTVSSGGDKTRRDKSPSYGLVEGLVRECATGQVCSTVTGNWRQSLSVDGKVVWECPARVDKTMTGGHCMTRWAWNLNCPVDDRPLCKAVLPKTDSRLRPDERALENGDYDTAATEKDRLEKAQRERKALREADHNGSSYSNGSSTADAVAENGNGGSDSADGIGDSHEAKWFALTKDTYSDKMEWRYKGGYFKAKMEAHQSYLRHQNRSSDMNTNSGHWPNDDVITDIF